MFTFFLKHFKKKNKEKAKQHLYVCNVFWSIEVKCEMRLFLPGLADSFFIHISMAALTARYWGGADTCRRQKKPSTTIP